MFIASISHGWAILSRALSHSSHRQTAATLALHNASRSTSRSVDFVGNTTKLNNPTNRLIFEDESEDYDSISRSAPPKTLSTMSRIETTLPLRLPEPVVSDTCIFEDFHCDTFESDYTTMNLSLREPPSSAFQALESLIRQEEYDEAWALCQEIRSSDIEIPKSMVYGQAAMAVLSPNDLSEEDQLSKFSLWLSMIPSAREADESGDEFIVLMRRRVFQDLQPTIDATIEFALTMASKGYAEMIAGETTVFITRFTSPAVGLRFIKNFLDADFAYVADAEPDREEDLEKMHQEQKLRRAQDLVRIVQGPAIATLARSGEFAAAVSLLPTSQNPFRLPTRIYDLLLSRLRDARIGSFPHYIELVEKLRKDPLYALPVEPFDYGLDTISHRTRHLVELEKELDPNSAFYIGESLAAQLRSIIDRIHSCELSVSEIVTFITRYHDSGRTTAIKRLRRLSLGKNWITGGVFLYAEMSYYLNHDLNLLVLETFANHFYFSGVPEQEITAAIRYLDAKGARNNGHPAYALKQIPRSRKWIPTESHTDLAWLALARSVPSRGVDELYHRFMQYQLRIRNPASENISRLSFPISIELPVGGSVFTVFLTRLLRPGQCRPPSEIFRDMVKIGVYPAIHHFTLLASFYADTGDTQRALAVVQSLEQEHPVDSPIPMQQSLEMGHKQCLGEGIPPPDVIFYASVLRSFVHHKYLTEAQEILRLFSRRFIYTPDTHKALDVTLKRLRQLKKTVDQQRVALS